MAKGLEINIDVKFNKNKVTTLQNLINNIEKKGITLNVDTSKAEISINSLMNKIKELQKVANNINVNWNNLNNNNNKNIEQLNKEKEILNQVITAKKNANEVSKSSGIKETDLQSYDKLQQKLNEIINSEKRLSSVTMKTDNLQNLTSAVIKYKNELGQAIAEQWKLITDKKTNISSFVNTSSIVSDNVSSKSIEDTNKMYQKLEQNRRSEAEKTANELNRIERERQQLIEQIENKRLQSTQRVKQEELSLQQIQAKFSNKALEQGYKEKQTTLYNEINNLLKEQYRIETQLITADGERKQTLQQNLQIIKQSLTTKSNNKEELLTQQQLNNLLNTEIQLKRNLETVQATKNDKVNQELTNTRELIQLSQKQLNNQLNGVQNRNGNLVNTSFLGQLKEALKGNEITNQIDQIRAKINALNGTNTKEVRTQVANLKAEIVELDQKAKMNGLQVGQKQFSSFGQAISSTLSKFGIFLTTATVCRKMILEIKEGIEYIKYLDSSFTDMAMTMDISRSQFNDMSKDIDELASKLGVTSQYVHDIARVYSNASTTIEEVMKKVKGASELANISGMNGLETTKAIQSITNQFNLMKKEGADAGKVTSHIADVLTKISQNMSYDFASGIQEMNNAISTSGSVAEMSGDGLERYTAIIGSLIEQTGKTGNELANAYKMISARVK